MVEGVGAASRQDLFLGLPPSITAMAEVGASTNMGIALQQVQMEGLGGIQVLKLHGNFTGAETRVPFPPLFNSGTYKN